jgi:hypothetical protein
VVALADWLERSRVEGGYGGPVVHWWRDCLIDCRAGHDWRYEGIVAGYLALHAAGGDERWLARAQCAADDLVTAQDAGGHFARSRFELNPGPGGTPHEAAASIALLRLAAVLGRNDGRRYLAAARAYLERGLIARLWDADQRVIGDRPGGSAFVPNKACTSIEALLLLAQASGEERWTYQYAVPSGEAILELQVQAPGDRLDGAIAQNREGRAVVEKYFPYYVARCVPALLALAKVTGRDELADAAVRAGRFVARCQEPDGGFPQVLYRDGRCHRFPRWVAATGDVQRCLGMLRPLGLEYDLATTDCWLAEGLLPHGGVMSARGFAAQASSSTPPHLPDLRDFLGVAGWADKAFRWLAETIDPSSLAAASAEAPRAGVLEVDCRFRGRRVSFRADGDGMAVRQGRRVVYRLRSAEAWPEVVEPWMAVR